MTKLVMIDSPHRVYFIQTGDFIKIGYTREMKTRFYNIDGLSPYEVKLLFHIEGDRETEAIIQAQFSHLRVKRDWFRATPELLEYIEELRREQSQYEYLGKPQFSMA